jgi:predicted phosphodiesterase
MIGALVAGVALSLLAGESLAATLKFALVSDLHLDIFYASANANVESSPACSTVGIDALGTLGCDSPVALLNSTVRNMILRDKPDQVIISGDWLRHNMVAESASALETYTDVVNLFSEVSSVVPVPDLSTAMGNNDVVPDYDFDPSNPPQLLQQMADALKAAGSLSADEADSYAKGAYYRKPVPGTNLDLLIINSLIYSNSLTPNLATGQDPLGQFMFLLMALDSINKTGRKAIIVGHVPPTINLYNFMTDPNATAPLDVYWQTQYSDGYEQIVSYFQSVIVAQIFGHTHRFSFTIAGNVPLIVLGAVSPVYRNNPNYFMVEYDNETDTLISMQQHYLPIDVDGADATWKVGATFPQGFNLPGAQQVSTTALRTVAAAIAASNASLELFWTLYGGNLANAGTCGPELCKPWLDCYLQQTNPSAVIDCVMGTVVPTTLNPGMAPSDVPAPPVDDSHAVTALIVFGCVAAALVAVCAGYVVFRVHRRRAHRGGHQLIE